MLAGVMAALLAAADPAAERAATVLEKARAALGLEQTRALSLKADLRRVMPAPDGAPGEMSGEVRVEALAPGRYKRTESLSPFPGAPPFAITFGLDGESAWTHAPAHHGGGGAVVIRMRTPAGGAAEEGALRRRLQGDFARLALATLLATDAAVPLSARHVAVAEAPEGRADVLELSGPDGLTTRLFVDTATHRPLMLTYGERRPRMVVRRMDGPPGGNRPPDAPPALPEEPAEEEATLHLDDFRKVGSALLPHRLAWSFDGQAAEEWTVREYVLDPALEPAAFRKK